MSWLRDLSIRAKVLVTGLGALLVVLGLATLFSLRYWAHEQFALTSDHALMMVAAARTSVEAALAHGQVGSAREQLQALVARPPAEHYRVVARNGVVLMSSRSEEEGLRRAGPPLPDPWDIPPDGRVVGGLGNGAISAVVPLSGVGGPGGRANLELVLGVRRIEQAIRRGRTFGLALTVILALAYALVLGAMMEREIVGPLGQLRSSLARAGAGEEGVRVGLRRGDELGRIGESVDALLAKEEQAERLAALQQRQLRERAGFAEIGALAAEVAHEIKRPLAGIKSAIELIGQEYAISDAQRELLSRVESELVQVDETLRDMLSLARPVGLTTRPLNIHEVIDGALARLAGTRGADRVTVVRQYDRAVPEISADGARLEQAILNLCLNAVEAMPTGGLLTVATRSRGDAVEVDVVDTGVGIPRENLERILKPFFSTKPLGTGLGLPLVARVVAAHVGRVWVDSEVGRGTAFHISLPVGHDVAAGGRDSQWPANAS